MKNEESFRAAVNFSLFAPHFSLKIITFAVAMTSIHKTNIILTLVALALAVLCILSIMEK